MKEILINIRDFSYLWTLKQMGGHSENEKVRYKTKFYYVVGIYYFTFLGLILYFSRKFGRVDISLLQGPNPGIKIILTLALIYLPIMLIGHLLLRSISSVPIDTNTDFFYNKRKTYLLAVLIGFALLVASVYGTTLLGKV